MQPDKKTLYRITRSPHSQIEGYGTQLALHMQIRNNPHESSEILCFYDTDRGHMIPGKIISTTDNTFKFCDKDSCIWEFSEVTIEDFKNRLMATVINGEEIARFIETMEDLWEWYRKNFPI